MGFCLARVAPFLGFLGALSAQGQFSINPLNTFGTNGWLPPNGYSGSTYAFLTANDTERGLACGSNHLYLVSRNGGDFVRIIDANTGADLGALNLGNGIVSGGTFDINMVAVAGDGAIYAANLAIGPAPFNIYRWANDASSTIPTVVYSGVPLAGARLGDSLAVIGSGNSTRLAAGFNSTPSVAGNNGYTIVDPSSGTANAIGFNDTPPAAGDFRLGLTFTDTNHVIGTQGGNGGTLHYTSYADNNGGLLASPGLASTDERPLSFAVVGGFPLLAALSTVDNHVSVYDLSDPSNPVLLGQANATVGSLPADSHNTGAIAWGNISGNAANLYAMATSDGIQAFRITVPQPQPPTITSQPQNETVPELGPAAFTVAAAGNPKPTYQWYRNGAGIPGATDATFSLFSVAYSANGAKFDVVAQNAMGAVTSVVVSLTVIPDTTAPTVTQVIPTPGTVLPTLGEIEIHFSEAVTGVAANDLLIDGVPATNVTAFGANIYVFDFPQPSAGQVPIAWNPGQGITDLASHSNHFQGADAFIYTLDASAITKSVYITEFMARNVKTIRDADGQASDWLELYNAGTQPINLAGWYLTDDAANLQKWTFPTGVTLLSKSYLLVWASGLDRTNPAAPLHTNFKLNKSGDGFLGLVYSDGQTLVSSFWPYPAQYDDISYGRDRLDPSLVGYFTNATPGAPNSTLGPGFGPEVQFSVASGTFSQPFTLALSTPNPNAVIRYVLVTNAATAQVGNIPGPGSPIYSSPLNITSTTQVRARAYPSATGFFPGPARNQTYIQIAANAQNVSSDLPMVVFHNFGAGTDVPATDDQFISMQVFDVRNGRSSLLNPPDAAADGYFHRRGQATFWDPKPNLRVQTDDAYGDPLDMPILNMPADNDWVFYGIDCFDKVLTHNPLAHELYREMGHYTSRTRYVEVYIKLGSGTAGPITRSDYFGLYVLEEKIKIGKNRVDIDKLQPQNTNAPSVTGGYLLSIDKSNPGSPGYLAGLSVWYLDPDYFTITLPERAAQKQYIDNYFSAFYSALTGPNWTDPVKGYRAFVDMDSWIDYHLHQTFVFNVDMLRISAYFYKPRDGKIVQGPLWDFDRAFADSSDDRGFNPRRWRSGSGDGGTDVFNPNCNIFCNVWYGKLFTDPDFWQLWIDRYQQLRQTLYSLTNLYARVDAFGNEVRQATTREYARWTGSGSSDTSPRSGLYSGDGFSYSFPSPGTWQGEINFTKNWFSNRVDFMDRQFLNPPAFSTSGGAITSGFTLTITAPTREANSTIYYTLDGTDPRLPGGAVSPTALSSINSASVTLTNNARVMARNWNASHHNLTGANNPPLNSYWSGPTEGTFVLSTPTLALTELMYDPAPERGSTNGNDQYEFIELKNIGTNALNLVGIHFTQGVAFTFTPTNAVTNLAAGQYLVLVRETQAFLARYPWVTNVAGQYSNGLNNAGERIRLEGALGETIFDFTYKNAWYPATDHAGFSLVPRDESAPANAWSDPAHWRASTAVGGSPGLVDPPAQDFPPVVINEALSNPDASQQDSIELYNPTSGPVPIGGWFLSDDHNQPLKYRIVENTVLPANGYLAFTAAQFGNNATNSFGLSSLGDSVYVFSGDGTNLTGYEHGFQFGPQLSGITFGRYVTSDGLEHFVTQARPTLGAPNAGPKVGPIVINEIMYAPPSFGVDADTADEFVELRNISGQPVGLFDLNHATNSWRLDGAIQFTFPLGFTMGAWSFAMVVGFDPAHDPAALNWFRARYGLSTNVLVLGPFQGHLGNQGERVGLYQPGEPKSSTAPDPGFVPYVLVEEVHYSPLSPWPSDANGTGNSLQRRASAAFADDPANWQAGPPTPGSVNAGVATVDSDGDGMPDELEFISGTDPMDPQDFLRFDHISQDGTNCVLEFATRIGHTYAVEKLVSLAAPAVWTVVQDQIPGNGVRVAVSTPLTADPGFYRLRVSRN